MANALLSALLWPAEERERAKDGAACRQLEHRLAFPHTGPSASPRLSPSLVYFSSVLSSLLSCNGLDACALANTRSF